jgi:quercetin dioxygenase-like cupin family protein
MEYVSGNIFIREGGPLAKDEVVEGHGHNFDHTTYVVRGAFKIERLVDGAVTQSVIKRAGQLKSWVLIKAHADHKLTALEDNSVYHCIFAHRDPQGEVVQDYDGWESAYV